jgi:lactoylglutathione lyase
LLIGYGNEAENTAIELTYNWGKSDYQIGTGFGHIAINVEDVSQAVEVVVFVALRIRHFDSFVYFVTRASRWRRT